MLTVRFPDGTAVKYNTATKVTFQSHNQMLVNERDEWVAVVPYGCIVEATAACSVSNPIKEPRAMLQQVIDHLREMPVSQLVTLKRELNDFNAQRKMWNSY
jgi:hypothetical protein